MTPPSSESQISPDSFVLYRIIGNDLFPRHEKGQSYRNVSFILEHEPAFPTCEKRWIVNRIVDRAEEGRILRLLEDAQQNFIHLPFSEEDYRTFTWDTECQPFPGFLYSKKLRRLIEARRSKFIYALYRHKVNYVMNNNGARNVALREGRRLGHWVLPWDGNCFLTESGWTAIQQKVRENPSHHYFMVPMARIQENLSLLSNDFSPAAEEEPQVIFRHDAPEEFNEAIPYGRRPKVELFWRLGVPGPWDRWRIEAWDSPKPRRAPSTGSFGYAGWVARLHSGQGHLESSHHSTIGRRGLARIDSVIGALDDLDVARMRVLRREDPPVFYDLETLEQLARPNQESPFLAHRQSLLEAADRALARGPYSVTDKTTLPPSQDPHDYWHPSPYYWPRPFLLRWLPMKMKDGQRVPGTQLYDSLSDRYDRTRLQRMLDDVTILALAWRTGGNPAHARHATHLLRTWFIDSKTRMNPHLTFAQVRRGKDRKHGCKSGVIELKDLYFFLDAVRLLKEADSWTPADDLEFRAWLSEYLQWLLHSPQGKGESASPNNHGTCYDLQVASIASFLGDFITVQHTLRGSHCRIGDQFTTEGDMPHELKRTLTQHYYAFNLQAWVHLAQLAAAHGVNLWGFSLADGRSIKRALERLFEYAKEPWPYPQIQPFESQRLDPLRWAYENQFGESPAFHSPDPSQFKPVYFPHDGIRPYWFLSR